MEKLIKAVGDGLDRRSFFRMLGKVGMGAAAVAGFLLLPRQALAQSPRICTSDEVCAGLRPRAPCGYAGHCRVLSANSTGLQCACL